MSKNVIFFERYNTKTKRYEYFFSKDANQPNLPDSWVPVQHRIPNTFYKTKEEIVNRFLKDCTEIPNPDSAYQA
jgi:uncharacterized membrane protein YcgQ (UPF0703/DUF1980 family)